jgi:CDP-glucose 4,6-dehydratase
VIGGGDWAEDRLVPDAIRAFAEGRTLQIRRPDAVRPWQYVLEPLRGYMILAERLYGGNDDSETSWNFGPAPEGACSVENVVSRLSALWGDGAIYEATGERAFHESQTLRLDSSRAVQKLGWRNVLDFDEALSLTVNWYRGTRKGANALSAAREQISLYMDKLDAQSI